MADDVPFQFEIDRLQAANPEPPGLDFNPNLKLSNFHRTPNSKILSLRNAMENAYDYGEAQSMQQWILPENQLGESPPKMSVEE